MKLVLVAALIAVAAANVVRDDLSGVIIGKETLVNVDVRTKELLLLKLLNHILQPTMYEDIREVARDWVIEDNLDKYLKVDVVNQFLDKYRLGLLPRGEMYSPLNEKVLKEMVYVFRILYFAKDFDTFVRTACWLRERINPVMFHGALVTACYQRADCRGITLPAPYEVYPYLFVDGQIINRAQIMKMTKAITNPVVSDYFGIRITDKNVCMIDWRKGVRHVLTTDDRLNYLTEDIDLNAYMFNLQMNFPAWMTNEVYGLQKERRGEVTMYAYQQLLARLRLERLSRGLCDIKPLDLDETVETGYWPKLRFHNGEQMPMRSNNVVISTKDNVNLRIMVEDIETILRQGILQGKIELRDGTVINLKKAEDIEYLARLILGGVGITRDDVKLIHLVNLLRKLLSYELYNTNKYTYVPAALDLYSTCLRDPVFWRIIKRVNEIFVLFKKMLPSYTRQELSFDGVKIDTITTDKLETFFDEYDIDITNALYLDESELQKKRSDMIFVARMHRLNNSPFKVNIEVTSDKAVDAVVRIFIGPKMDCMGRLIDVNDKRQDMVEIDSFVYKLETGKNTIVRGSTEMHGVIGDRPWARRIWDKTLGQTISTGDRMVDNWWAKSRIGFPRRLLLPLGRLGGYPLQMYVIVTPVRTGLLLPTVDVSVMKDRQVCYFTSCVDTMPLGFPFDRQINLANFFTSNMKFVDVMVQYKDMNRANNVKTVDTSDLVMKRDDLTIVETDLLVRPSYRDVMMLSSDTMSRL